MHMPGACTRLVLNTALILFFASAALAQPGSEREPRSVRAARIASGTIVLDGAIGDVPWRSAEFVSGFIQNQPDAGAPSEFATSFAVLYDDHAIYIGARMGSPSRESIM